MRRRWARIREGEEVKEENEGKRFRRRRKRRRRRRRRWRKKKRSKKLIPKYYLVKFQSSKC